MLLFKNYWKFVMSIISILRRSNWTWAYVARPRWIKSIKCSRTYDTKVWQLARQKCTTHFTTKSTCRKKHNLSVNSWTNFRNSGSGEGTEKNAAAPRHLHFNFCFNCNKHIILFLDGLQALTCIFIILKIIAMSSTTELARPYFR